MPCLFPLQLLSFLQLPCRIKQYLICLRRLMSSRRVPTLTSTTPMRMATPLLVLPKLPTLAHCTPAAFKVLLSVLTFFFSIQRSLFICVHDFDPLAVQLGHAEHHPPERCCRHGYFLRRSGSTPCWHVGIPQGKRFRCHGCVEFQITPQPMFSSTMFRNSRSPSMLIIL